MQGHGDMNKSIQCRNISYIQEGWFFSYTVINTVTYQLGLLSMFVLKLEIPFEGSSVNFLTQFNSEAEKCFTSTYYLITLS